jgi:hypothetical protein
MNDQEAQRRTVADIRNTGIAMSAWLIDQVGAGAATRQSPIERENTINLQEYPIISRKELEKILVPKYMQVIPETDGWGHTYEFYLNVANPLAPQVMGIRSPGRDGRLSVTRYDARPYSSNNFDEDIVWVDGFFVRWPHAR